MTKAHTNGGEGNESKPEPKKAAAKKLHLKEIRSVQADDGSIVHHHTYADHKDAKFAHPERGPMATSTSPEDAGQHVAEQFGMNGMSAGVNEEAEPAAAAGAAPAAQAAPAQAPPEE
jgi:hypothetical protein